MLEVAGTPRLAQDSTSIDACIAQCGLEQREEGARLWGALQNELAVCDSLGTFDTQTLDNIVRCSALGTIVVGGAGAIIGGCVTGIPGGAAGGFLAASEGPQVPSLDSASGSRRPVCLVRLSAAASVAA